MTNVLLQGSLLWAWSQADPRLASLQDIKA
jgi:hypothetical protein